MRDKESIVYSIKLAHTQSARVQGTDGRMAAGQWQRSRGLSQLPAARMGGGVWIVACGSETM
jgi:hypothetical protein